MCYLKYKEYNLNKTKIELFYKEVNNAIKNLSFSCLEVLMLHKSNIILHKTFGYKKTNNPNNLLKLNSIFDLASLTKPIITATLTMMLIEKGHIKLYDPVHKFIKNFTGNKSNIKIIHLLNHSSGLPAWHNLYTNSTTEKDAINKLLNLNIETLPETKTIYSCLGYICLKLIIEKITNTKLDKLAKKLIFKPLNMKNSFFNPPKKLLSKIVPTGYSKERGKHICGEVNDDNAFCLGGTGGNAGLFSTAFDIAIYANTILNKGLYGQKRLLSEQSIKLMTSLTFKQLKQDPWGLGFQIKRKINPSCGEAFSQNSFGHTGFTGTAFWLDPNMSLSIILLTNRIAISYRNNIEKLKTFRKNAYNLLISAL